MINEEFVCAREACGNVGVKTTHNMKFCSPECCRIETNRKIMEKYHERAAIKRGKARLCKSCGSTKLSRYNENDLCGPCERRGKETHSEEVSNIMASVAWL